MQRLLGRSPVGGVTGTVRNNRHPRVLAITADLGFYSGVLSAATSAGWRTEWARTLNRATEICRLKSPPIVIYDSKLPGVDWEWAFECLSSVPNRPRMLLAAPSIDEDLWRNVLRRHGYDVVERSAGSDQLGGRFDSRGCLFLRLGYLTKVTLARKSFRLCMVLDSERTYLVGRASRIWVRRRVSRGG